VLASQLMTAPAKVQFKIPALHLIDEVLEKDKFVNYLPVYSLAAAAGGFSDEQTVRPLGWATVKDHRLSRDMFIARVKGKSMEPTISDGSYCIFRWERGGSRNGKVVLVQCQSLIDPESSGQYTVKRYESEKELFPDGTWKHKRVVLSPDNKDYQKIILEDIEPDSFKVVAEYVSTLG
jgi:phage repressor protein C with HTH and peptisase S24 domain